VLRDRYAALDAAFADYPHDLHYAIKANATLAVVREMRAAGAHADANSGGEIELALRAGFTPDQIVFTGVGKTHDELVRAVTAYSEFYFDKTFWPEFRRKQLYDAIREYQNRERRFGMTAKQVQKKK
jgi:diaminopimelate decarboxylase